MPTRSFADLMETVRAFQESRLLLTAAELNVFSAVGDGASTAEVAARLGTDPRATGLLLNALVPAGALEKHGDTFRNTDVTARFLTDASPGNARAAMLHSANMWESWSTLTRAVRFGTAVIEPGVEKRDPAWMESFLAAMHRGGLAAAPEVVAEVGVGGARRMLDIGGGPATYAIAFAQAAPGLEAEVLDLPEALPVARRHIEAAGLASRVRVRVGGLRQDEFGADYDLILLSSICHMLSEEENRGLLERCFRATAPGGRLVIRDFILGPDRASPKQAALFALNMLVATRAGSTYTEAEYVSWLRQAGYTDVTRLRPDGDLIVAARRIQ